MLINGASKVRPSLKIPEIYHGKNYDFFMTGARGKGSGGF